MAVSESTPQTTLPGDIAQLLGKIETLINQDERGEALALIQDAKLKLWAFDFEPNGQAETPSQPADHEIADYLDDRYDDVVQLSGLLKCLRAACAQAENDATLLPCIEISIAAAFDTAEQLADKLTLEAMQQEITKDPQPQPVPQVAGVHPYFESEE